MTFKAVVTVNQAWRNIQRNARGFVRGWLADIREAVLDANIDRVFTPGGGTALHQPYKRVKVGNRKYERERSAKGRLKGKLKANAGRAYDDTPLPVNADSTIQQKALHAQRRGGSLWSLLDQGVLTDRRKWRRAWPNQYTTTVSVPAEREGAIAGLNARGYRFAGIPRTIEGLRPSQWAQLHLADLTRDWSRRGFPRVEAR